MPTVVGVGHSVSLPVVRWYILRPVCPPLLGRDCFPMAAKAVCMHTVYPGIFLSKFMLPELTQPLS